MHLFRDSVDKHFFLQSCNNGSSVVNGKGSQDMFPLEIQVNSNSIFFAFAMHNWILKIGS